MKHTIDWTLTSWKVRVEPVLSNFHARFYGVVFICKVWAVLRQLVVFRMVAVVSRYRAGRAPTSIIHKHRVSMNAARSLWAREFVTYVHPRSLFWKAAV